MDQLVPGRRLGMALFISVFVAACGEDSEPVGVATEFDPSLDVDLAQMTRTESGLYLRDLTVGPGPAAASGDSVVVHYTGWLPDGTQFDSSLDGGEPLTILLGAGEVIAGWDEGLVGMRVGGRRQLVIPPDLGYGSAGLGGIIPPNATLVFEVELLEVRDGGG